MRARPRIGYLLNDLQSPINIGQCARVAETYGIDLHVNDPRKITESAENSRTISDFSCGAWDRRGCNALDNAQAFMRSYGKGRLVATCLSPDAVRLPDFQFESNDLIIFGNEYDGLDTQLLELVDEMVYIPLQSACLPKPRSWHPIDPQRHHEVNQNGVPNLNVAITAGIVAYAYSCWLEMHSHAPSPTRELTPLRDESRCLGMSRAQGTTAV
jgi:tRNA(Leu) C34 or U34 (ribose-2'-O)-methylase TrmL